MAITINGSGTITGISQGGLPDDVITADDIKDSDYQAPLVAGTDYLAPDGDGSALTGLSSGGSSTPYISVRLGSSMTANASYQKLVLDTEDFDSDGNFDTSTYRFTPQTSGKYFVICHVNTDSSSTGALTHTFSRIYKNGSLITGANAYMDFRGYGSTAVNATSSVIVSMNGSTDYLEFYGKGQGSATHYLRSNDTNVQAWKIE